MLRAFPIAFVTGCFVLAVAACVGGPGPLPDQGANQSGQGGTVTGGSEAPPDEVETPAGKGSSGSSGNTTPKVPSVVTTATYDTSCKVDDDCVAVYQGSGCTSCRCVNAAINKKDLDKYTSALQKAVDDCGDTGVSACDCAAPAKTGCDSATKKCALGATSGDAG